jgi:hypothetical protein
MTVVRTSERKTNIELVHTIQVILIREEIDMIAFSFSVMEL